MVITGIPEIQEFVRRAMTAKTIVYDLETTGLEPYLNDRIVGASVFIPETGALAYIPFGHRTGNTTMSVPEVFKTLFSRGINLVGYNLKFDVSFTERAGVPVQCVWWDVMLAAHLCNENETTFRLKSLGAKYVDPLAAEAERGLMIKLKALGKNKGGMDALDPAEVAPYAEQDVLLTWKLLRFYAPHLKKQGLDEIWSDNNRYEKAIYHMERAGMLIDPEEVKAFRLEADKHREKLLTIMRSLAGFDVNPRSVPQLQKVLGVPHTDRDSLSKMDSPFAKALLAYRMWERAITVYYDKFLAVMDSEHRVHTNLNLIGTVSGRLSCNSPNLQALPKETDIYKVRSLVRAPAGKVLVSFDYSQIEMRVLAHYTHDPFLMKAYRENLDIHQMTADAIRVDRFTAKTINYGIVYGIGAHGLSEELKIPELKAAAILADYHMRIPGIKRLYRTCETAAETKHFITMWTGRRRHFPDQDSMHKAMSNLIQGGVAEIVRVAIERIDRMIEGHPDIRVLLQVHDELIIEIDADTVDSWLPRIKVELEAFKMFRVPILSECKLGPTWGSMKKVEEA